MPAEIKNFSQFVASHNNGAFNEEVSQAMQAMIEEMQDRALDSGGNQKATLSITLSFGLQKGIMYVDASKKVTLSKDVSKGVYWPTAENTLQQSDPKQPNMFEDVNTRQGAPRTA